MPLLLVVGSGPGNSHATARRFGREEYDIALVGRDAGRLQDAVARLSADGVEAHPYVGDAADKDSLRATVEAVRREQGPVSALLFTAYRSGDVGDVLAVNPSAVEESFRVGVTGLLAVVQASLDDLRAEEGAVLVVNGAVGNPESGADRFATSLGVDGVALESAAKSKLVGLLAERLRSDGVYVGEVTINGSIKGSPYAGPTAIDPADVADRLWEMAVTRSETRTRIAEAPAVSES